MGASLPKIRGFNSHVDGTDFTVWHRWEQLPKHRILVPGATLQGRLGLVPRSSSLRWILGKIRRERIRFVFEDQMKVLRFKQDKGWLRSTFLVPVTWGMSSFTLFPEGGGWDAASGSRVLESDRTSWSPSPAGWWTYANYLTLWAWGSSSSKCAQL